MRTNDQQRCSPDDQKRQRSYPDSDDRQRPTQPGNQVKPSGSWLPAVLTLLFMTSLSLTYSLLRPETHPGLGEAILSRVPLLDNSLALLLALTTASLLGLLWLSPLETHSDTQAQTPINTPLPADQLESQPDHSLIQPVRPLVSRNVPLQHIRKVPLRSAANQSLLP